MKVTINQQRKVDKRSLLADITEGIRAGQQCKATILS
jgi:hypothetical protein